MEYLYTSVIFLISIAEGILFYSVVFKRKMAVVKRRDLLPLVILYFVMVLAVFFKIDEFYKSIIIMALYYFVGCIFTQTGKVESIKYWIMSFLLGALAEWVIYELFFENNFGNEMGYDIGNVLTCTLLSIMLLFINKISGNRTNEEVPLSSRIFIFLTPLIGVLVFCLSYMIYVLDEYSVGFQKRFGLFIFLFATIGIFIAIIILLHTFQQKEHFRLKADLENKYNEQQREYFMLLLDKEKETRRFRHDIVNHLLCIQDVIRHKQFENADKYIADLLSELDIIRNKQYDLGDEVVNVLLNYYLIQVQDICSISIEGYLGKLDMISQMDTCMIFSNLLKNVVEAVEEGGSIKIDAIRKAKFAEVVIGNSCSKLVIVSEKRKLETTKKDKKNHGFGLENVQRVVRKNHGEFQYKVENNWFEVKVILQVSARSR